MNDMAPPPAAGSARAPSPSTQAILHRDGRPVPEGYELEAYRFLGDADIPFARYFDQGFFDREMRDMWSRTWQWACREEHIAEPGDWIVYDIGDTSILVVRAGDGTIRAHINSCMHRGTKIQESGTSGSARELRCRFHGWTWNLDGGLKRVPSQWDAPHVCAATHSLVPVRTGLWGGFVFINLDAEAPPLEEYLAPLIAHCGKYRLENRFVELHIEKELFCNWKAAAEAFLENYHTQETHPQLLAANADEATQYDILSPIVTRFLTANGVSSPHLASALDEEALVETSLVGARSMVDPALLKVAPGETARVVLARVMRDLLGRAYGADFSGYADTEVIDINHFYAFPGMMLMPGLTLPAVYRIRPKGNDPDRSIFELLVLRECPADGPRPEPAEVVRLGESQSYAEGGLDPFLAEIYDQDTGNLRAQQEGFKAARKLGQSLLNYQEIRIRQLHETLDGYLAGDRIARPWTFPCGKSSSGAG